MSKTRKAWTEKEITLLKKMVKAGAPYEKIAEKTGHSIAAIKNRVSRTHIGTHAYNPWTDKEIAILIKNSDNIQRLEELLPQRNYSSIYKKAKLLGVVIGLGWTEDDEKYLRKHYPEGSIADIAEKLGRTELAVRLRAVALKIKRSDRYWDKPEEDYVMKNWMTLSVEEIAEKLNKSKWAVYAKRRELLNKKNPQ